MNRQTFLNYLEEPSRLYQLSLVELQGLVLEYPYSASLRLLLLLKARLEDHPRKAEMLQQASSRTFDRAHLYDLLRDLDREERQREEKEERLELPELDKLDFAFPEPELREATEVDIPTSKLATSVVQPISTPPPPSVTIEEITADEVEQLSFEAEDLPKKTVEPKAVAEPVTIPRLSFDMGKIVANAVAGSELSTEINKKELPTPKAVKHTVVKENESGTTQRIKTRLRRHRNKQLQRLKAEKHDHLKKIASESVSNHEEIASETLAKLLAHQGQYAKAIKMYERLSLLKPKKKAKFAALIQDLKEKL